MSRSSLRLSVAAALLGLAASAVAPPAAADSGTALGPQGGTVSSLSYCPADPVTLHAGLADGGVWRGAGMGESWTPERRGLAPRVHSLADLCWGALVAGTGDGTLYYRGGSWHPALGLERIAARDLLAVPAASHGQVWQAWAATHFGLYVSRDGGESWTLVEVGGIGPTSAFSALGAVDLPEPALLAVSDVPAGGLFRSTDDGATWSRIPRAAGLGDASVDVRVLASAPGTATVYAAVPFDGTYPTVFRSDDGGRTWRRASAGLPETREPRAPVSAALAVSATDPDLVLAGGAGGLYRSTDGGTTWRLVATPAHPLVLEPLPDGGFLLGTDGDGVYDSRDGGLTWRSRSRGLDARPVLQVVPDPRANGRIWALVDGGDGRRELMLTEDWGSRWATFGATGSLSPTDFQDLVVHPAAPQRAWARAFNEVEEDLELYAYRSDAGIGQFLRLTTAIDWERTTAPAADPTHPPRLYVLENDPLSGRARLHRSNDGHVWEPVGQPLDGLANGLAVDPRRPSRLWAWRVAEVGDRVRTVDVVLWTSDDEGATWRRVADVDDPPLHPPRGVETDEGLFAFGQGFDPFLDPPDFWRLLRSLDGGASWELVGPRGSSLPDRLAVDPSDGRRLYRLRELQPVQVERSTDGGATWEVFWEVPEAAGGHAIALSADGSILYAATAAGLWARSTTPGAGAPPPGGGPSFPPPPPGAAHTTPEFPGFRFWSRIVGQEGQVIETTKVTPCLPETLCLAGSLPDRVEVLVRIVGPKGNGYLWPTVVRFTTSTVDLWIEQVATGEVRYYRLEGVSPGVDELTGFFDRLGFRP